MITVIRISVENPEHSDFAKLRNMLIRTHMQVSLFLRKVIIICLHVLLRKVIIICYITGPEGGNT